MTGEPAVSIIMIFHNADRFIAEAVGSVVWQTFDDWELLLVDDGSTDDSERIARGFADEHPGKVRYLTHSGRANLGTAPSRNRGFAEARGRYLTELDADDVWLPTFLEHYVGLLEEHRDIDLAFGPVERWYSWSGDPVDTARDWIARPWPHYEAIMEPPELVPIMLRRAPEGGVPKGLVFRRRVLEEIGGYPEQFRDMYEDQALVAKLGLRYRAYVAGACLYRYRRHAASMVSVINSTRDRRLIRQGFLEWMTGYLRAEGCRDPVVGAALRGELWKCRYPGLARARQWLELCGAGVRRRLSAR